MAGIDDLLPRARSPVDYLNVVTDPRLDQDGLRALASSPYPFVRRAVAACPTQTRRRWPQSSPRIWTAGPATNVLAAIARHPNADRPVLVTILTRTRALLDRPDERPFAAALALARRPELDAAEILDLANQPYASRRMARGIRRAIHDRPTAAAPSGQEASKHDPY